jgi:actin-binding protein anillin
MSLKERMAIFEKNKGTALVPKAAFGMAPSIKTIIGSNESSVKSTTSSIESKIGAYNKPALAESKASGSGIKNKVAALMSGGPTIAESKIAEESKRQRQEEMDQLLNRFPKKDAEIPVAPPLPPSNFSAPKRRSSKFHSILKNI